MSNGATLSYDAAHRLAQTTGGATTRFLYDGQQIIGEYDASGNVLRRYVPGPGTDQPIVWYEGSGTSDRRFLITDRQGSVTAVTNDSGGVLAINTYDEAGIPGPNNTGRFQYNAAPFIPEAGLYHMRARAYSPTLGRFMQPDPIGYGDGMNVYNYVHGDPVNGWDPSGLEPCDQGPDGTTCDGVTVTLTTPQLGPVIHDTLTLISTPSGPTGGSGGAAVAAAAPPQRNQNAKCSALRQTAGSLGRALNNTSEQLGTAALVGAVGTVLAGGAEEFTLGLDTPVTIYAGSLTSAAGTASFVTGGLGAALTSFSQGNRGALTRFNQIESAAFGAKFALSKFGPLAKYAEAVAGLTEKAAGLAIAEKEAGCGGE